MTEKYIEQREQFARAIDRLAEAVAMPKTDIVCDAAVKRFEMAFDLAWKTLKSHLGALGVYCASPRACFEEGFRQNVMPYDAFWVELVKARNLTVHAYNVAIAERVYAQLPAALQHFRVLLERLPSVAS